MNSIDFLDSSQPRYLVSTLSYVNNFVNSFGQGLDTGAIKYGIKVCKSVQNLGHIRGYGSPINVRGAIVIIVKMAILQPLAFCTPNGNFVKFLKLNIQQK